MLAITIVLVFFGVTSAVAIPAATVSAAAAPETSKAVVVPVGNKPNVSTAVAQVVGKNGTDITGNVSAQGDFCGSNRNIPKGHAITLRNNLQAHPDWYVYIPAWDYSERSYGNAKLCFYNPNSSDSWISEWDAGWTIDYMTLLCCVQWGDYWYVNGLDDWFETTS